jgi:single-stranded DNA-binding protein
MFNNGRYFFSSNSSSISKIKKKGFDTFTIYIWGNLGEKVIKNFRVGDYVIIEGVLSFTAINIAADSQKELKFTVFNICPFLLVDID